MTDTYPADFAALVADTARRDPTLCMLAARGDLTPDVLRAEMPRLLNAMMAGVGRSYDRFCAREDYGTRRALAAWIHTEITVSHALAV